jgi:hypothetical protein
MRTRMSWSFRIALLAVVLLMAAGFPQAQSNIGKTNQFQAAAVNSSVKGNGTPGHISKWVTNGEIGDSEIIETDGKVSITASLPFVPGVGGGGPVLDITNTGELGFGLIVHSGHGGEAIRAIGVGGNANALRAEGGSGSQIGGYGIVTIGGDRTAGAHGDFPGDGILSKGGDEVDGPDGGLGVVGLGGNNSNGSGGIGVFGVGGQGNGFGNRGGIGISGTGGRGVNGATSGLAGLFGGDVEVTGTFSAATKNFKIDHPLDPENKYLYHTSVESPDMMNIYNGNIITNENGEATVKLPEYFQALNRDFRYQLTVIGTFAHAIIADEIKGNRFVIRTNAPNVKVSWLVTGIRRDAWANRNRSKVEEDKPEQERGSYLHPEAFNQNEDRGVKRWRDQDMLRRKEIREMRTKHRY